jgi:hypothetical protein
MICVGNLSFVAPTTQTSQIVRIRLWAYLRIRLGLAFVCTMAGRRLQLSVTVLGAARICRSNPASLTLIVRPQVKLPVSSRPRQIYVRFEVLERHHRSGQRLGLIHAIRYMRDDGLLTQRQLQAATVVINWLADHLSAPGRIVLRTNPSAVSWFRESSGKHLVRMQRLVNIAESNGVSVRRRQTMTPGRIVYSDLNQVLALPRERRR